MARSTCFALLFLSIAAAINQSHHHNKLLQQLNDTNVECLRAFKSSVVDINNYLSNWNFSSEFVCNFTGVTCWNPGENKVLSLKLEQAGLSGAFPAGLSKCTSLEYLSLAGNDFKRHLPPDLCDQMPDLAILDLSDNQFSGEIPSNLANCVYLNELHLEKNILSGEIPGALGLLPRLNNLDLSSNNFSGIIPSSFTNRSSINGQPFTDAVFENNPHLCGPPLSSTCTHEQLSKHQHVKLKIAGGALLLFVVMACAFTFLSLRKAAVCWPHSKSSATYVEMFDMHLRLTWQNLQQATSSFSHANVVGVGGSSTVYKGKLNNGKLIAIKVLQSNGVTEPELSMPDIQRQFLTELEVLGKLRHHNLVRILGYCYNLDTMAIILDFMSMGSLDALLHSADAPSHDNVGHSQSKSLPSCSMRWKARFGILVGIAEGLAYLHNEYDGKRSVVHGDLKPSNVLLNELMEAHIADFGLARMVGAINTGSIATPSRQIVPGVRGWSFGYTAPECAQQGMVSRKSDVFSFGVTTLELLTGERPSSSRLEDGQTLADWVGKAITKVMVDHVIARALKETDWEKWEDDITAVLKLGCSCASFTPAARPDMPQVMTFLHELAHKQHLTAQSSTDALHIDHNREAELWILS